MSKSFKNPNFYIDNSGVIMDDNGTTLDNFTHLKTFTSLSQIGLTNTNTDAYTCNQVFNAMPDNSQLALGSGINISDVSSGKENKTLIFQKIQGKQSIVSYAQTNTNQYGLAYWHKKPDGAAFWDNVIMGNGMGNFFQVTAYSTDNITMSQTSNLSININIPAPANYRNIAIAGVSIDNATTSGTRYGYVTLGRYRITSVGATQAQLRFSCYSASGSAKLKATVYILQARYIQ